MRIEVFCVVALDLHKKLSVLPHIPPLFLDFCTTHGTVHRYAPKQFIYLSGDEPQKLFILLKGSVQLILANEFVEKIYRVLKAPTIFPEVVLDGKPYVHSAYVIQESEVLALELKSVQAVLAQNPELYQFFFKLLALDYRRANRQIRNLALGDARVRIGSKLYSLAHAHGRHTREGIEITIALSTTELAGMCGLARESASRILSELKDLNIIKADKKTIVILNLDELRAWIYKRAQRK